MTTDTLRNEPITTMFTDHVRPDKVNEYEDWSTGIHSEIKQFPGFLSVDVIRPEDSSHLEYITLLKFDSCENLKRWQDSSIIAELLEKLPDLLVGEPHAQECEGLELWFDRPSVSRRLKEPSFWKQVIIGIVCVYPLVILLRWALSPVTEGIPWAIALLINVTILSALLTYPVMPLVTRMLRPWLYPK